MPAFLLFGFLVIQTLVTLRLLYLTSVVSSESVRLELRTV